MKRKTIKLSILITIVALFLSACGSSSDSEGDGGTNEITIGYFPNMTHIATIVGLENGYFDEAFGEDITIDTRTVTNGGLFMEAMATDAIDVGTVGPGPLLNFYVKDSNYHMISGAVNGGAVLVADKDSGVTEVADLDGKTVAIPVIGSTQDVMLRKALQEVGLSPTTSGGTVEMHAAAPADSTTLFAQDSVQAAATQEPWGYVLETQANGQKLLDWDEFAWGKDSTNTVVAATAEFKDNEELAKSYLTAHKQAVEFIQENPEESQELVIKHLKELTGQELNADEVEAAFNNLEVTTEVNEEVIQEMADISLEAEYIPSNDIDGLIDLSILEGLQGE
ncbi:aliphatic sulfonate ABC transporter substrate-binding protein [Oceanobacillus rekensis]|uniref:aliphatic sulfonate ABC transporter substrate-binding protein n=1 Tax=Oceanobacillus rekensis TaxID=937927 RepID=UPI000B4430B2|nr:aliphatic sulfonate ABC transporter substrate-binding protein [Oceanobacillus rekensis]